MKSARASLAEGADKALIYTTQTRVQHKGVRMPELIRTIDEEHARELIFIHDMMSRLVKSNGDLFHWPLKPRRGVLPRRGPQRLAADFLRLLRPSLAGIRLAFPRHEFHPLVELFEKHMESCSFWSGFRPVCKRDVDELNACVEALRAEGRSKAFRRRLDKQHKGVRRNTRSLLKLVDHLFMVHSQLLVVRIDLAYGRQSERPQVPLAITEEEATQHRDQLVKQLRRGGNFKPVGYAWKLEYTEGTTWHIHLLLFFDANRHQRDIDIATAVADRWKSMITNHDGRYFICNMREYRYRGVGKIHYSDSAKLWALTTIVVPYITKADYYAKLILRGGRTFGRSGLPKIPTRKRGRPRLKSSARVSSYVPHEPPLREAKKPAHASDRRWSGEPR